MAKLKHWCIEALWSMGLFLEKLPVFKQISQFLCACLFACLYSAILNNKTMWQTFIDGASSAFSEFMSNFGVQLVFLPVLFLFGTFFGIILHACIFL